MNPGQYGQAHKRILQSNCKHSYTHTHTHTHSAQSPPDVNGSSLNRKAMGAFKRDSGVHLGSNVSDIIEKSLRDHKDCRNTVKYELYIYIYIYI